MAAGGSKKTKKQNKKKREREREEEGARIQIPFKGESPVV
jgi:hypothetical protein